MLPSMYTPYHNHIYTFKRVPRNIYNHDANRGIYILYNQNTRTMVKSQMFYECSNGHSS